MQGFKFTLSSECSAAAFQQTYTAAPSGCKLRMGAKGHAVLENQMLLMLAASSIRIQSGEAPHPTAGTSSSRDVAGRCRTPVRKSGIW